MAWNENIAMKSAVHSFLIRNAEGKIDVDMSVSKFRSQVIQYLTGQEASEDLISHCLNILFDRYPGAFLYMTYIQSQVISMMATRVPELSDPTRHNFLAKRVQKFVQENTGEGKTYTKKMGPGGGFGRNRNA